MLLRVVHARRLVQVASLGLVFGLLALLVWRLTHQVARPKFGQRAPSFSLPLLNGEGTVGLADFSGKPMLINFWSSTCVPCAGESRALEQVYRQNRRFGLVVLGIDPEDFKSDARGFIRRHNITYPNLNDPGAHTADRYGIGGTPESFLIDRHGRVVQILLGPIDASANRRPLVDALRQILHHSA
jgi:cytochrome c biogenesis protein CcmG, thiol:disulfide interchange protein DsbE